MTNPTEENSSPAQGKRNRLDDILSFWMLRKHDLLTPQFLMGEMQALLHPLF